jgi:hypothetical protein
LSKDIKVLWRGPEIVDSAGEGSDDLVMLVLVGASLVGLILGLTFLFQPRGIDRYTELYFVTHKVALQPYSGVEDFNYSGQISTGEFLGMRLYVLGPETDEEVLVLASEGGQSRFPIYETFKVGDTYIFFADATSEECLLHEYCREVPQFETGRLRFVVGNRMGKDRIYYYKVYLGEEVVDSGEVPVASGESKDVVSSFPVGSTENEWTRVAVVLNTGENISFGFRTYR